MSAPAPSRLNKFKGFFRRGATPAVPAGPNSGAVNAAVKTYVANFRNMQSVARQPNLYGNSFKNLPINRPLIKALRNYINASSNFKKLSPNTTNKNNLSKGNVGGLGPAKLSKQNVLNAANKVIKAATVANNKLGNVATLRTAYTAAAPLAISARQLYKQLYNGLPANQAQEISSNGTLNQALTKSEQKLNALKNTINAAEKAAGTGAVPVSAAGIQTAAANAALAALKSTINAYNNNKLNVNNPDNLKMYMNMTNLNARRNALNKALANVTLQGRLNNSSKNKLAKVKAIINKAKNQLNLQAAQVHSNNAAARNAMTQLIGNYVWNKRAYGGTMGMAVNKNFNKIAREIKANQAYNISKTNKNRLNAYLGTKTGYNQGHRNRAMAISTALFATQGNV